MWPTVLFCYALQCTVNSAQFTADIAPLREVAVAFRSATRVCSRPSVIPVVHGWAIWCHYWVRCTGHAYADDTQVYVSTPAEDHSDAVDRLTSCIIRFRDWMARNRLKLNEDKTRVIWLGTCQQLDKVMVQTLVMCNAMVPFSSVVNDLGVLFDSELTMANQIVALGRSCFFHLRRLRSVSYTHLTLPTIYSV